MSREQNGCCKTLFQVYILTHCITHLVINDHLCKLWVRSVLWFLGSYFHISPTFFFKRVWRYQKGNQHPYIIRRGKDNTMDKQRCTKLKTYTLNQGSSNTNPTKNRGWAQVLRKGSSSCSTNSTRCVNLVTNPAISHEWEKDREVFTISGFPCRVDCSWISV